MLNRLNLLNRGLNGGASRPVRSRLGLALEPLVDRYRMARGGVLAPMARPSIMAFTRASVATDGSAAGDLDSYAVDAIRNGYAGGQRAGWLLEGQAQNLLLNSTALSTQSVTVTAAQHTLSFYGTGTVTLSGASTAGPLVGTGATNLVQLQFTPTAGSLTLTVSGSVTNAQLEANYYASSRIVTAGTQVTRANENAAITGNPFAAIFSNGAPSGFVICDVMLPAFANLARLFSLSDGTLNNALEIYTSSGGSLVTPITIAGAGSGGPSPATALTAGTPARVGLRFGGGSPLVVCCNGISSSTASAALPVTTGLYLGNRADGSRPGNSRLRGVWAGGYTPSDAAFQAACTPGANVEAILGNYNG